MTSENTVYRFTAETDFRRLDMFVSSMMPDRTRSNIKNLIEQGSVTVNGRQVRASSCVRVGDAVTVEVKPPHETDILPQDIPVDIVYEDADIAVINKPSGMVVHPACGNEDGTLVNAIMYHIRDLSGINGELRPGIVHRLDKNTSGLLVIAKNDEAHVSLAAQIKEKSAKRYYRTILIGNIREDSITVNAPIGRHHTDRKKMAVVPDGRDAETVFTVLERFGGYTYAECELKTGRTHQIRVHARYINHPVAGDDVYSSCRVPFKTTGQLLHAFRLVLRHPGTGEIMEFEAPLPQEFSDALVQLGSGNV